MDTKDILRHIGGTPLVPLRRIANGLPFLTDQFRNPANVRVHEETTGAEILEQTGGQVGAFVAGAGNGRTISGDRANRRRRRVRRRGHWRK